MKEATGELSTTVIAIVAIAAIAGLFTVFLLPMLRANIILGQACGNGAGYYQSEANYIVSCANKANNTDTTWQCQYTNGTGANAKATTKTCVEKND